MCVCCIFPDYVTMAFYAPGLPTFIAKVIYHRSICRYLFNAPSSSAIQPFVASGQPDPRGGCAGQPHRRSTTVR